MNGFRTLVLQDLPHVLPPKGFQLTSSSFHTTSSARRFWNLFEFTPKSTCADARKCSKEVVSTTLVSSNEFEDSSKTHQASPAEPRPISSLSPKAPAYPFDLRTTRTVVSCSKIRKPLEQDNLVSLLDGNPVPRTLKWKLKGYKTLRNEQAGDFAFVPGGACYDCDILTRSTYGEIHSNKSKHAVPVEQSMNSMENSNGKEEKKDTLSLTTKAIENKEEIKAVGSIGARVDKKAEDVSSNTVLLIGQKEDIKYLPIMKTELSSPSTCQPQSSIQYFSQLSTNIPKPTQPILEPSGRSMSSGKSFEERGPEKSTTITDTWGDEPEQGSFSTSEWSSAMHEERDSIVTRETDGAKQQASSKKRVQHRGTEEEAKDQAEEQSPTYFAPRSWKQANPEGQEEAHAKESSVEKTYESIIGLPPREHPALNISNSYKEKQTSPCAATQARLQDSSISSSSSKQVGGSSGFDGSPVSGGSGGGSRKPPSFPPFTPQRMSSSNSSSLLRKLTRRRAQNVQGMTENGRNPVSNISTSSVNPRKCRDRDEGGCNRRDSGRSCEQERPKCPKRPKKSCKRYCCPALQRSAECDYEKMTCPKNKCPRPPKRPRDPTCLPDEETKCGQEREICTEPQRNECSRRSGRSCNNRRSSNREQSCQRERSCPRQQPKCPQVEPGRVICTKPKKRESCNRRGCDDDRGCGRSANCSGRRHYTQGVLVKQPKPIKGARRFSSLPAVGFPLIGMRMRNESKHEISVTDCRFYSKCKSAPPGPKKCKKGPAKCLNRKGSKCGPSKSESKCKASCEQRRLEMCKERKSVSCSKSESTKERCKREKKEIQECKKPIKKKEKKEKKSMERVVSPCKQKKSKPGKCSMSSSAMSCMPVFGAPFSCLPDTSSSTSINDSKLLKVAYDQTDTCLGLKYFGNHREKELSTNDWGTFWNFTGDDNLDVENDLPLPVIVDNPDSEPNDNSYSPNTWFLPWFNQSHL